MVEYVRLDPPVTINVAGNHRLFGIGKGVLVINVLNHVGSNHSMQLPVTIVPGLGQHLFSGGTAAAKGLSIVIANHSYLDLGDFTVPLRKDSHCSTLDNLDLTTAAASFATETAFPTVSDNNFKLETAVMAAQVAPTALSGTVGANTWHKRRGHLNGQGMAKVKNITESGVNFYRLFLGV